MSTEHCKLAAVLFADMVGYSAKRRELALEFRREMLTLAGECLAACEGRLISTAGDEVFAEFPSGSAAITCAMRLQDAIARRNARETPDRRFALRVGINAGEVTMEGKDLIGGTVNVAKRAEQLAAPGGVCVTEPVWQQAESELQAGFTRLGMISVKADPPKQVFFHRYDAATGAIARRAHLFRVHYAWLGRLSFAAAILLLLAAGLPLAWPNKDPEKFVNSGMSRLERYDLANNIQGAIGDFKNALRLDPKYAKATDGLAWAQWLQYQDTGESFLRGESVNHATNALGLNPNVPYADVVLGLLAQENGANQDAVDHLRLATGHSSWTNAALIARLAEATQRAGDRAEALDLARRAEAKAGQSWETWHRLGVFWNGENDSTNSLRCFTNAANLNPPSFKSADMANSILIKLGRRMEALERASQQIKKQNDAKENDPARAWSVYGNALMYAHSNVLACQAFEHAARLDPANYTYWGNAGIALFKARTNAAEWTQILKDEAVERARTTLRDEPRNLQARTHLATYEAALGDESSGLTQDLRDYWNTNALADADRVFEEKPFLKTIISALEAPYSILDNTDRLAQCEARLQALGTKTVSHQTNHNTLPSR